MILAKKILGHKSYGSIPHLAGSRLGEGDHHCEYFKNNIKANPVNDYQE